MMKEKIVQCIDRLKALRDEEIALSRDACFDYDRIDHIARALAYTNSIVEVLAVLL